MTMHCFVEDIMIKFQQAMACVVRAKYICIPNVVPVIRSMSHRATWYVTKVTRDTIQITGRAKDHNRFIFKSN